ncbi:hypothetical protein UlMin_019034 [Ulmus minor]
MHITIRKKKKGWKLALVCVDTFQASVFDQLKQNTTKAKIPFYGTIYMKSDPVKIVVERVETFKKENCNLIIVDTSGRHKQEAALFEEMRRYFSGISPSLYLVILSIGQAAFDQAQAFKQSVLVGVVIVFEFFYVTTTNSPVIFIGAGEHMDEHGRLVWIHGVVPMDLSELIQKLLEGSFSLGIINDQFQNILKTLATKLEVLRDEYVPYDVENDASCGRELDRVVLVEEDISLTNLHDKINAKLGLSRDTIKSFFSYMPPLNKNCRPLILKDDEDVVVLLAF